MARQKKSGAEPRKINLPEFCLNWINSIRKLRTPKFIKKGKLALKNRKLGSAAVVVGIAITLAAGALANIFNWQASWIYYILAMGIIVGTLNAFRKEGTPFLIAALATTFMLTVLAGITVFPAWAINIINAAIYFLAPASLVVGLKTLYAATIK